MKKKSFLFKNSLSIVLLSVFLLLLAGQIYIGWKEYNEELLEKGGPTFELTEYMSSAHFMEATFENWESEFLQMGMYVLLTISLRQQGSSESKSLDKKEPVDREPKAHSKAPWPVKKGGWWLKVYKNSLSIAFLLLFIMSFIIHAVASLKEYNTEQLLEGKQTEAFFEFMCNSKLWFESLQNWQSEFIAVLSIVLLSVFLRQHGSPESKPVDAAHNETGS
jgi:hypothetical protein